MRLKKRNQNNIVIYQIYNMATVKSTNVYTYAMYGGIIKGGYVVVGYTDRCPEDDFFDSFKEKYGYDVKGRYVKCSKPLEEVKTGIVEALTEYKYGDSESLYKYNVTDIVKVFKEITGAKKANTLGVYDSTESKPKRTSKKSKETASVAGSTDNESEVSVKSVKSVEVKPKARRNTKKTQEPVEEKPVEEKPKKTVVRKSVAKKEELEEEPKKPAKASKTIGKSKVVKVEIGDDTDELEELEKELSKEKPTKRVTRVAKKNISPIVSSEDEQGDDN
jgi:hypothetical protein